jgi:hypothetical protein
MRTDKEIRNLVSKEFSLNEGLDPEKITIDRNGQPRICVWFDLDTDKIKTHRLYDLAEKIGKLDDIVITAIRKPENENPNENLRIEIYLFPEA